MSVLYITQNGVTDHIGRSQIAPYLIALARQGFAIHVLSAEKPEQEHLVQKYQSMFDTVGIRWTRVTYRNRPPLLAHAWTQHCMARETRRIVQREQIRLIHCRSFPPALIANALKTRIGVKFIFDFRDFYADGGLAKTHGLTRLVYRRLKRLEGSLIRNSDKVVCLTERARDVLTAWYLSDRRRPQDHFQVIPCCADFDHFDTSSLSQDQLAAARARAQLNSDDTVLLYLGSLGPDYLLRPMMALFRQLLVIRPNAIFLFLSNNGSELVSAERDAQGVPADRIRFISADRDEVPAFIALATLSVLFIRADVSKVGCSPTKLAELFACNVPLIANSGVGDLDEIISLQRNGSAIVNDFSDASLRAALEQVLEARQKAQVSIRESSWRFSLGQGVTQYATVYRELLTS